MVFNSFPRPSKAKYSHCMGMTTESAATNEFKVNNPREGAQSIIIKSYSFFISSRDFFSIYSLYFSSTSSISMATKSICAAIMSKFGELVCKMASLALAECSKT
ncbi:MAG: Uncharacterised protein [Flavobacterium sp. SCGC AAA160-P02]|nr:MAG: Uncharacterised protein [Flavobacterium sp. SCGC AAA160-P02]